jgi:hypothetical protein
MWFEYNYLIHDRMYQALIEGIPLLGPKDRKMANGLFSNVSFLNLWEDKWYFDNTLDCIHIFYEASASKIKKERIMFLC